MDQEILKKKMALIQRYAQLTVKESNAAIGGDLSTDRKDVVDLLRAEIDREIQFYNTELEQLQKRRSSIWDAHQDLESYLIAQEKSRNEKLDNLYQSHTSLLEKIYLRHNENEEHIAVQTIDAGSKAFDMLSAPWKLLTEFFKSSSGLSPDKAKEEAEEREKIQKEEAEINADTELDDAKKKGQKKGNKTPALN